MTATPVDDSLNSAGECMRGRPRLCRVETELPISRANSVFDGVLEGPRSSGLRNESHLKRRITDHLLKMKDTPALPQIVDGKRGRMA